ncbi:MAG: hypothetical protein ACO20Q_06770 [Burkholderiaceae bacterium]
MPMQAISCIRALVQGPLFFATQAGQRRFITALVLGLGFWLSLLPSHASIIAAAQPHPLATEDFAAIELNGRQISRGSLFFLRRPDPSHANQSPESLGCWIERRLLEKELDEELLKETTDSWLKLSAESCDYIAEETRLLVKIAPQLLKARGLQFGRPGLSAVDALQSLHSPTSKELPSAHLDVFRSRRSQQLGLGLSYGPAQFLMQGGNAGGQATRYTLDWLFESGSALQFGDLSSEVFAQDALTERRGLRWTSRHRPLRQPSTSPGLVQIDQPSRLRVMNEDGMALYATGLLPAGQYRLEGLSAPGLPGFLQLELESLSGERQTVLLPWVTSPLLLDEGDRLFDLEIDQQGAAAAQTLLGLTPNETLAAKLVYEPSRPLKGTTVAQNGGAPQTDSGLAVNLGLQSRRWLGHVVGAELLGQCPDKQTCNMAPGFSSRSRLAQGQHLALDLRPTRGSGQVSLRQSLGSSASFSVQWSRSAVGEEAWLASWSQTLTEGLSLTASVRQLRQSAQTTGGTDVQGPANLTAAGQSQFFLGLQFRPKRFKRSQLRSSMSLGPSLQRASLQLKQSLGSDPEALELSLRQSMTQTQVKSANTKRQESLAELRTRRPQGNLSLQWRQNSDGQSLADFSLASRIWLTPKGLHLGSPGDHNLLLVDLKTPGLELSNGLQRRTSNANGLAALTRTGAWTSNRFRYNLKSLPFDQASPGPLNNFAVASRRAYWLEAEEPEPWAQIPVARLDLPLAVLQHLQHVLDPQGRALGFTPEGHVDLGGQALVIDTFELELRFHEGLRMSCKATDPAKAKPEEGIPPVSPAAGAERLFRCEPLPLTTPDATETPPSSGSEARAQYQERPKARPSNPS